MRKEGRRIKTASETRYVLMIILSELFTTWFHEKTELRIFTNFFYFLKVIRLFFTKDKRNKLTRLAEIGLKLKNKEFIIPSNRNVNMDGVND